MYYTRDIKVKKVIMGKERYYIMLNGSILQEDITILNVHAPNKRASNSMRQKPKEIQGEKNKSTTRVGDFNNSLSKMDRSIRQNISKDVVELNSIMNQLYISEIYKLLHPKNIRIHIFH